MSLPELTLPQSLKLVLLSLLLGAALILPFRLHIVRFIMGRILLLGAATLGILAGSRVYESFGKSNRQNWASLTASIIIGVAVALALMLSIYFAKPY